MTEKKYEPLECEVGLREEIEKNKNNPMRNSNKPRLFQDDRKPVKTFNPPKSKNKNIDIDVDEAKRRPSQKKQR